MILWYLLLRYIYDIIFPRLYKILLLLRRGVFIYIYAMPAFPFLLPAARRRFSRARIFMRERYYADITRASWYYFSRYFIIIFRRRHPWGVIIMSIYFPDIFMIFSLLWYFHARDMRYEHILLYIIIIFPFLFTTYTFFLHISRLLWYYFIIFCCQRKILLRYLHIW